MEVVSECVEREVYGASVCTVCSGIVDVNNAWAPTRCWLAEFMPAQVMTVPGEILAAIFVPVGKYPALHMNAIDNVVVLRRVVGVADPLADGVFFRHRSGGMVCPTEWQFAVPREASQ